MKNNDPDARGKLVLFACEKRIGGDARSLERSAEAAGFALRVIPLPCSSALEPAIVLRAFEEGADAVEVLACQPDACRLGDGSRRAASRMARADRTLAEAGLGGSRILFRQGEPDAAQAELDELIEAAWAAGPSPLREKP